MPNKGTAAADAEDPLDAADPNYDPQGPDHGLMELKTNAELEEQMRERGFQFSYSCYQDGNPEACHSLGQWLSMWRSSPAEGAAVFKHNCDKYGFAESCFKFANYRRHGARNQSQAGAEQDPAEARAYYDRACNQLGHRRSCLCLGRIQLLEADQAGAGRTAGLELLRRACLGPGGSEGVGVSCVSAAVEHLRGGLASEARGLARAACDAGDAAGCDLLSRMLRRGDGGPADVAEADRLRQRARDSPESEYARVMQQAEWARRKRRQ